MLGTNFPEKTRATGAGFLEHLRRKENILLCPNGQTRSFQLAKATHKFVPEQQL
jgi:hypothetical protein